LIYVWASSEHKGQRSLIFLGEFPKKQTTMYACCVTIRRWKTHSRRR